MLGDAIQIAPAMPKSGHMANGHAKVAAAAIVAAAERLGDRPGADADQHAPMSNNRYRRVTYRGVTSSKSIRLPSGHFALTRVRRTRGTAAQGPAYDRDRYRLRRASRRTGRRSGTRRPGGRRPGPIRQPRTYGSSTSPATAAPYSRPMSSRPAAPTARGSYPADRAAHQLGPAPDRIPRPGPAARRLGLRRGQLQRPRLLAVRRRDRGGRAARHRRRLQGDRLGARQHPRRPRPHRHGRASRTAPGISLLAAGTTSASRRSPR